MKILLVDNHILFREGIASLLMNEPDIEAVNEARNAAEAAAQILELKPDLILMEFGEDLSADLDTVKNLSALNPEVPVVLLTNHDPENLLVAALRAGAKGFLCKDSSFNKLLASIRGLQRGELALSRMMTSRALDLLIQSENGGADRRKNLDSLTTREMEVLKIIATGASNQLIADTLSISENTVKIHVHKILKKLNVRNRREAARCAQLNGISLSQVGINPEVSFNGRWR